MLMLRVTADSLYRLMLITALILLIVLLYNNIVLYHRKLTDTFSLMHMASVIMCIFEMLWDYTDGHPDLISLTYFNACGYTVAFLLFATILNYFFLDEFDLIPKKWIKYLFYILPNLVFFLISVTTPWTRLLFLVDEAGHAHEMVLYYYLFNPLLLIYLFTALLPAVYFAACGSHNNPLTRKISINLIIFGVLIPFFYLLEMVIIGNTDNGYMTLSLACALALVYLTSSVNTYQLIEKQAKIDAVETELRIAASIQSDALPPVAPEFPDHPNLNLCACMNTAREVGGDFYDYFPLDDHRLCFLIADVSDKGTPAALFMMTTKTIIKDYALMHGSTSEIFDRVNRRLCEKNDSAMFVTAWIGILDTETMVLQYTNAGHNYPVLQRNDGSCEFLTQVHGLFLGGLDDTQYGQEKLTMCSGDRLLLYTDGVTEAHNMEKELYGEERLLKAIKSTSTENGEAVLAHILEDVNAFSLHEQQFDDITMMVLTIKQRYSPSAAAPYGPACQENLPTRSDSSEDSIRCPHSPGFPETH